MRDSEYPADRPNEDALLTDLYQLTMLQAYRAESMSGEAVFELFVRRLVDRNYLVFAGLASVLDYLESISFSEEDLDYLRSLGLFSDDFLESLRGFRFEGSVLAFPEGSVVFAGEPLLQIRAPLEQAQFVETFVLNQITFQTNVATKASRVVRSAGGRPVYDFGARRVHGAQAADLAARSSYLAGVAGTSNVRAGKLLGIPVFGTMAHSYIQAHDDEDKAFVRFADLYPGTTLLVDTYDTISAVQRLVHLSREHEGIQAIGAIRLDSGNLAALARESRTILDEGDLGHVRIIASGSLDEFAVRDLIASGAPIDAFGVGTSMGTVADRPFLDSVYKLVSYDGRGRVKLAEGKQTLPGLKSVFRKEIDGRYVGDTVGVEDERLSGSGLLDWVMVDGVRTAAAHPATDLETSRARHTEAIDELEPSLLELEPSDNPYPVRISRRLTELTEDARLRQHG
jgi:nicotinate phosphoribosyltransferase